jgi:hypothetical protein
MIIDLDRDDGVAVRCYPHVVVGYGTRKEFTIDPALDNTGGDYTMLDFTEFLRQAYSLPRHRPDDDPGADQQQEVPQPPGGRRRR